MGNLAVTDRERRLAMRKRAIPSAENDAFAHAGAMVLFPLGGALNTLPASHSPMGNRDARWVFNIPAAWEKAEDDAKQIAWARGAWQDLKKFSTGGTYINFLTEDDGAERTAAALGGALERLARIKSRWDPANVFRTNRNVPPA